MATLIPMTLTAYQDKDFQIPVSNITPYKLMINPDTLKEVRKIEYDEKQPPGSITASQRFRNMPSGKLNFDIIIDCTGIVNYKRTSMVDEIDALEAIVYDFDGKIHRPNFVAVQWGSDTFFYGVLNSMNISYTLFKPDGSPLRAKVVMGFTQYISPKIAAKKAAKSSPDLTHLVTVVEGMSLPQLSMQVWNDDKYYVQVAKYNNLNKFRNLKGITALLFPPITQPL